MKPFPRGIYLFIAIVFLPALACNLPVAVGSPAIVPPETVVPLYQQVTLASYADHEEQQRPNYTSDTQTPVLEGSDDARVEDFNALMKSIVQDEVLQFKGWMAETPAEPMIGGSYLGINFVQVSPYGDLISIKFSIAFYIDGAAHPGQYSRAVTYDLERGEEIPLEQLFLPGIDYLKVISTYCIAELRSRDIGFDDQWMSGADPTSENYRNWNITAEGLLVTFDPYQVAAYAAGPQEMIIPYAELATILDPNGPLAGFLP